MSVWVIGGTSGIGAAVASLLEERLEIPSATGTDVDVTIPEELMLYQRRCGPWDGVVFSAGVNQLSWIKTLNQQWQQTIMDTNYGGFVNLLRVLLNDERQRPIHVLAVSSDAARRPMRTSLAYCSSKAALNMAVQCAARELGPKGWRINAIAPGMTDRTEMTAYIDKAVPAIRGWTPQQAREYERSQQPVGRRGTPEEMALMILDVLYAPDYLNGSIIEVNGGR